MGSLFYTALLRSGKINVWDSFRWISDYTSFARVQVTISINFTESSVVIIT